MDITPALLVTHVLAGLAVGSLYGIVALGLVLVYKASDVVNFAHGEMATVGSFLAFSALAAGAPLWLGLIAGVAGGAVLGPLVERFVLRPARDPSHINLVVITIGLNLLLNGIAARIWGTQAVPFPSLVTGPPVRILDGIITRPSMLILGVTLLVVLALVVFFRRSTLGTAMLAVAENAPAAAIVGLPVGRILLVAWGIAGGMGALAGVLVGSTTGLDVNVMSHLILKAFTGAVLGGLTSLPGVMIGCLLVGVAENMIASFITPQLVNTFSFLLIVAILLARPAGLFGRTVAVKL